MSLGYGLASGARTRRAAGAAGCFAALLRRHGGGSALATNAPHRARRLADQLLIAHHAAQCSVAANVAST